MPLNSVDEIYKFSGLDTEFVQPSEIETTLAFAADLVTWFSPEDDSDRSARAEPLRKRAEAYLATAELYRRIAPLIALANPGTHVLSTLDITISGDTPTPIDYQAGFAKAAASYEEEGKRLLKSISPVTATISAGK